jgi:hypothetical protein
VFKALTDLAIKKLKPEEKLRAATLLIKKTLPLSLKARGREPLCQHLGRLLNET